MNRPTLEECKTIICERAIQAATWILNQRGTSFREGKSLQDAREVVSNQVERLKSEEDFIGATACLMQAHQYFQQDRDLQRRAKAHAQWLMNQASDAFYDWGKESSLPYLQLAAGLDPENAKMLWEVIAPCLQGSHSRPREALPYAILVAHLSPEEKIARDLAYIERLIEDEELKNGADAAIIATKRVSSDWPTAGGNNRRTGVSQARIEPPLEMIWCCKEVCLPRGGIVVSSDIAVCGDWSPQSQNFEAAIHGVDIRNGHKLWTYPVNGIVGGTPAISGEYVYTGSTDSAICLELTTGQEVWKTSRGRQQDIPVATKCCPLCIGQLVVYCDDHVVAFDAQTGEVIFKWSVGGDAAGNMGPCSDERSLYLPEGRSIVQFDIQSGGVKAEARTDGKVSAGPILADTLLIYGSSYSLIEALDAQTLKTAWTFTMEDPLYYEFAGAAVESAPAYSDNLVYCGGPDGNVYALHSKTGKRLWKHQTGAPVSSSPIISGGTVYVMTGEKRLCALSAENGKLKWQQEFRGVQGDPPNLAVTGSLILVGADYLYAFASAAH